MSHSLFKRDYQYYKKIFKDTRKPFAFVDLDLFDENITQIKQRAGDKKVRVASKSIRCRALIKRVLDAGEKFHGVMSFSADEAVFLSRKGFDDILVAYPVWQQSQIEAVISELKNGKNMVLMIDSKEHIDQIDGIALRQKVEVSVCIDVDMSSDFPGLHFGVHRSGIKNSGDVKALAEIIQAKKFVRLKGLMGYEAQIAGVGDNAKGQAPKNSVIKTLKKKSVRELGQRRKQAVENVRGDLQFVNAGGTGSLESSVREGWVTEVTVGSGFFSPGLFDNFANFKHHPAAAFAIEITRRPKENIYTCLGGGYIGSGAVGKDKQPKPYLPEGAKLLSLEGAGEVQTPVLYKGDESLALGDPIFLRHSKAGELCERFNQLYLVADGGIVDEVPTYRGEGKCFI